MPSIEERVASLEAQQKSEAEKTTELFKKFDKLIEKLDKLTESWRNIELEHVTCNVRKGEATVVTGWLGGRFTKVFDSAVAAGLALLCFMLLKNSGAILAAFMGGAK